MLFLDVYYVTNVFLDVYYVTNMLFFQTSTTSLTCCFFRRLLCH